MDRRDWLATVHWVMSPCIVFTPAWKIGLQKLLAKIYFFFPSLKL